MFLNTNASRRDFLSRGLGVIGVSAVAPSLLMRTALADGPAQPGHRVLVVLQLSGGHDALSELVPYSHKEYHEARRVTRIPDEEVLKINDEFGLHPNLQGVRQLLDEGTFAAVAGVGYDKPNYSHFTSTDIWQTADQRGRSVPFGWIGRVCDTAFKGCDDPKLAIAVGAGKSPLAIKGDEHPGVSFERPETWRYVGDRGDKKRADLYRVLNEPRPDAKGNLEFLARTARNANVASEEIRRIAAAHPAKAEYPNTGLGRNLRVIASLIAGGLSTRIYFTDQGGYDTHFGQKPKHDKLMADLNDAVCAFMRDLAEQKQIDRVLLMTTSEFGRRVKENGSEGTDHGAAAASYFFGTGVKSGIHGQHPSLTDLQGGGGGSLKHTCDFRSLYATVLERWMNIPSEPVLGDKYPLIPCLT